MVGRAKAEEAEAAEVAMAEAMTEEEGLVEEVEAEAEEPQRLIPMTQARATLQRIGGP